MNFLNYLLTSIVLFGALNISYNYDLSNSDRNGLYDKEANVYIEFSFLPTTYNSLFKIVEKSPYKMEVTINFFDSKYLNYKITSLMLYKNIDGVNEEINLIDMNFDYDKGWKSLSEQKNLIFNVPITEKDTKFDIKIRLAMQNQDSSETFCENIFSFNQNISKKRWYPST